MKAADKTAYWINFKIWHANHFILSGRTVSDDIDRIILEVGKHI